jgi:hypothetical protein
MDMAYRYGYRYYRNSTRILNDKEIVKLRQNYNQSATKKPIQTVKAMLKYGKTCQRLFSGTPSPPSYLRKVKRKFTPIPPLNLKELSRSDILRNNLHDHSIFEIS